MKATLRFGALIMLLGALPLTVRAQLRVDSIEAARKDLGDSGKYSFPQVSGGDPAVATRINAWLQMDQLQMLPGHGKASPFENIWPEPGSWQGIDALSYEVVASTRGYLALAIQSEGMGAYPSQGESHYNFDVRSGTPLQLEDLFSPTGLEAFKRQVRKARLKRVDDFLAGLPKPGLVAKPEDGSDEDTAETQRQLYTDCRSSIAEDDFHYNGLSLEAKQLVIIREHCAPHVIQALDDLWDFRNAYAFAALRDQLNAYGRCLLIEQRDDCRPSPEAPRHGVLLGTLGGRYRVTFLLGADGSGSSYAYDAAGTLITLQGGQQADGSYRFVEQPEDGHRAVFALTAQADGSLAGSWTQDDTGKVLRVLLH